MNRGSKKTLLKNGHNRPTSGPKGGKSHRRYCGGGGDF